MRTIHRAFLGLMLALAVAATASPAAALEVRLEVAPQVTIPLNPILDGLPLEFAQGPVLGIQEELLLDLSQGTGGGASISLLLSDFEIRYEFTLLPWDTLTITHVKFPGLSQLVEGAEQIALPAADLLPATSASISGDLDAILIHTVGVGYRFTPWNWVVHPYFPVGLGFTAAQLRNGGDTLLGFNIQLGAGVQWDITKAWRLGIALRYNFAAYKNPDTTFSNIANTGIQSAVTNRSSFEAVMETLQSISFTAHISYRF